MDEGAGQLMRDPGGLSWPPRTVVVVPAVGFAAQSVAVLDRSLRQLAAGGASDRLIVVVVNRPVHQAADSTMDTVRRVQRELVPTDGAAIVAFEAVLNRRPRVGELRQLAVDALEEVGGPLPGSTTVVVADDDVVHAPAHAIDGLAAVTSLGGALAIGPVLFDDPVTPTAWFPDLFVSDLVRALVGDALVATFAHGAATTDASVFESLVLSCHLAVRRDALAAIAGFRDLNEIAGLLHDTVTCGGPRAVVRVPAPAPVIGDPVVELAERAVRVSSRRALAAWLQGRHPTVAQWSVARFRSSKPDPVRIAPPRPTIPPRLAEWGPSARRTVVKTAAHSIATTLDYLQPTPELAASVLSVVGLEGSGLQAGDARSDVRWALKVGDPAAFLERLAWLQDLDLGGAAVRDHLGGEVPTDALA